MSEAGKDRPPEAEEPWERNRRARLAQIEAEQDHGRQLVERYGRERLRPRFAAIGHASTKLRRLRR